ncbi:MAG: hypothetical protein K5930_08780 [Treponemataceae bacterium]|nr:hypothetical protein [Treponemataceae bacterium]
MRFKKNTLFSSERALVALCAMAILLSFAAAVNFEAVHAGHEEHCHVDDCPLCLLLRIIHCTFRTIFFLPSFPGAFSAGLCLSLVTFFSFSFVTPTLVSQKIKLVI